MTGRNGTKRYETVRGLACYVKSEGATHRKPHRTLTYSYLPDNGVRWPHALMNAVASTHGVRTAASAMPHAPSGAPSARAPSAGEAARRSRLQLARPQSALPQTSWINLEPWINLEQAPCGRRRLQALAYAPATQQMCRPAQAAPQIKRRSLMPLVLSFYLSLTNLESGESPWFNPGSEFAAAWRDSTTACSLDPQCRRTAPSGRPQSRAIGCRYTC